MSLLLSHLKNRSQARKKGHKAKVLSHPRSQDGTTSRSLDNLLKEGTYLLPSK